jgi:glutathione S-transferase
VSNLYLVTIGPSPYSEKARWALDLLGRSYTEERCAPGFVRPALKRIFAGTTAPALVVNKKDTYSDSTDILRWVDSQLPGHQKLFPEDPIQGSVIKDFCQRCDTKLAPEVIAFVQTFLTRAQFAELCTKGVPPDQAKKFRFLSFFIHFFLSFLAPPGGVARCLPQVCIMPDPGAGVRQPPQRSPGAETPFL